MLIAISQLDGRKPPPRDNDLTVTAQEFSLMFNISLKKAYESLDSAASRLYERDIKTYDGNHKARERFRWVNGVKYWDGEGKVTLSFSNKIIPYLTLLHDKLTSYDLKQISTLSSSYAIRFYELMMQFKSTGVRWITITTLKERLELQEQYSRFFDFKKRIIDPAINEINNSTNILVSWALVKKGRVISGITFNITAKNKKEDSNKINRFS